MKKQIFLDTMKRNRNLFLLFLGMTALNGSVFLLYRLLTEAFWYAEALSLVLVLVLILLDYFHCLKKTASLEAAKYAVGNGNHLLPVPESLEEAQYQAMLETLEAKINHMSLAFQTEKQDWEDWYTTWVHQIKTPIAVLRLKTDRMDQEMRRELFRIEEYADMALSYIRLGSVQNDLVIREVALDEVIRESVRKYAPQFIAKKLRLEYDGTDGKVITDKKWLLCILEQLISNAIKYTDGGTVKITLHENVLIVSDTGIGIAPEELPRIFEKGYTGSNGRTGAKASGLGLYLADRAAKLLGLALSAQSTVGCGSQFSVSFPNPEK